MNLLRECKEYLAYLKKHMKRILVAYIVIEIFIFLKIGQTNILMFSSSLFVMLFILCSILLSFKDSETNILVYILAMPLLPIILYLLARLDMKWIGSGVYWIYFSIFIVNILRFKEEFNFSITYLKQRYKYTLITYFFIIIIAFISVFLSNNKLESGNLVALSIISTLILSLVILTYKKFDYNFLIRLITYLAIGVALSSIPDILIAVYSLIFRGTNQHLYGVLGSNFMLGYTLMVLPFIMLFAVNKEFASQYRDVYKILLLLEVINLCTQMSRGIAIGIFLCMLFVILYDRKNYKKYLLISLVVFICLVYNITHRWEFNQVVSEIQVEGVDFITSSKGLVHQMIQQFKSRRPIWIIALQMIYSYPYFGVGPGQFKNYYLTYGGNPNKMYIDAHNIFFNVATEFGLVFTGILFLSVLCLVIKAIICIVKYKEKQKFLVPAVIGLICLLAYGNITGQSFITSTYPISYVPAFIFMFVITLIIKVTNSSERN